NIGGPKTPRRPLARSPLRRASERMRAQRRSFGGRRAARQKCADEPGEQVTTAPGREAGIATRDDMFWPAQIGDDGGNAFEQHGALELRGGAPGGGPAIVGGFVRQRVAGERSELTKVRSADKRAIAPPPPPPPRPRPRPRRRPRRRPPRRPVGTKHLKCICIEHRR